MLSDLKFYPCIGSKSRPFKGIGSFFFDKYERYIFKKLPHENIRQNKEYRERNKHKERRKRKKNKKTNGNNKELVTKKRTKEHRDRFTRGESPSPRPIKKEATKISEQLVIGFVPVLKSTPISLPSNTPH